MTIALRSTGAEESSRSQQNFFLSRGDCGHCGLYCVAQVSEIRIRVLICILQNHS